MKQSTFSAVMANSIKNLLQGYTKGIRFTAILTILFTIGVGQMWGATETYEKVTSAPSDWSGEYLIVYETGKVAFNGSLTTLDATSNTTAVTISDNKISLDPNYSFTIAKSGSNYTVKSKSGYYVGQTSNANGLKSSTSTSYSHTISFNNDGTVNLVSGGAYLRYNLASDQLRFRYYKSSSYTGQKAICLYKKKSAAYTLHYGTDGQTGWNSVKFEETGSNNEMQISNFTIPSTTHFYVGKPDFNGTKGTTDGPNSNTDTWGAMYLANSLDVNYADASPKLGQATGAVGTIRIYSNSTWNNKQAAFIPNGYKLKFGTTEYAFTHQSNGEYHSDIVQYNTTSARYNVSAGVINGSNEYVATNNTQEMQHIFLNSGGTNLWSKDNVTNFGLYDITNAQFTCLMVKVPGEDNLYEGWVPSNCTKVIFVRLSNSTPSWDNKFNQTGDVSLENNKNLFTITQWDNQTSGWSAYTRKGKFRMNDNYKDKNWYVRFYPHYVVNYDANGGDGTMAEQTVPADNASIKISTNTFTRTGYSFNGWKTQTNGGSSYTAGTSYTITSDLTLYAQWKANTYTITYKDGGNASFSGTHETGHPTTHTYGTATTLKSASKTGYIFGGWYKESACTNKVTSLGATAYTANITLYAKWTPNTYTITLNANGGSGGTESVTATYNSSTLSPAITNPTKTGYTFTGWYSGSGGTGNKVIGTDGKLVVNVSGYTGANGVWTATENKNLYAGWTINSYTLTWNVNGGNALTGTYTKGSVNYGAAITKPENPTRTGYTFLGWHDGTNIVEPATKMPDHNLTYTAQWKIITYTIKWNVDGSVTNETVNHGAKVAGAPDIAPNNLPCGQKFAGWTDKPITGTTDNVPNPLYKTAAEIPAIEANKTFYAVFADYENNAK